MKVQRLATTALALAPFALGLTQAGQAQVPSGDLTASPWTGWKRSATAVSDTKYKQLGASIHVQHESLFRS
jgi:hypothetical protein